MVNNDLLGALFKKKRYTIDNVSNYILSVIISGRKPISDFSFSGFSFNKDSFPKEMSQKNLTIIPIELLPGDF